MRGWPYTDISHFCGFFIRKLTWTTLCPQNPLNLAAFRPIRRLTVPFIMRITMSGSDDYYTHNGETMAGRPKNPDTDYKVIIHQPNGYRYAATQPHIIDSKTGAVRRRYCYWGDVLKDLKFTPNDRFLLASPSERARLIFPEGWVLSAIQSLLNSGTNHQFR